MRAVDRYAPNIMDSSIPEFKELHSTVDSLFRQLRSEGVGAEVKHAPEITKEEENRLWEKGVLGVSTPLGLLRAVFYCNGKNFCLRGGQEHRRLKISQLSRSSNPDRYVYTENGSKNHSGGFMQLRVENKVVPIYASKDFGDRCHVRLLDLYLSKIPERARKLDVFYLRPLPGVPANPEKPWYAVAPCGENKLASMVKEMFLEIGVEDKTNHSLWAAGTTELFRANVPEKIIQQRTGHRSLKALRTYERTTSQQHLAVSRILSAESKMDYKEATSQVQSSLEPSFQARSSLPAGMSSMFGVANNCVINVNFGHSNTSVRYNYEQEIPEDVEKALAEVDLDFH